MKVQSERKIHPTSSMEQSSSIPIACRLEPKRLLDVANVVVNGLGDPHDDNVNPALFDELGQVACPLKGAAARIFSPSLLPSSTDGGTSNAV